MSGMVARLIDFVRSPDDRSFTLSDQDWQDVVYFARRLGWERSYDPDGVCRSIGAAGWTHNITWCRETKRPYYSHLPDPSASKHSPVWLHSLKDVLARVVEAS